MFLTYSLRALLTSFGSGEPSRTRSSILFMRGCTFFAGPQSRPVERDISCDSVKKRKIWWQHSQAFLLSVLISVITVLSPTIAEVVYFLASPPLLRVRIQGTASTQKCRYGHGAPASVFPGDRFGWVFYLSS